MGCEGTSRKVCLGCGEWILIPTATVKLRSGKIIRKIDGKHKCYTCFLEEFNIKEEDVIDNNVRE